MSSFRLLDLPMIPVKRILLFLTVCQRINLAICSDVVEEAIQQVEIRVNSIFVCLLDEIVIRIEMMVNGRQKNVKVHFNGLADPVKQKYKAEKVDKKMLLECYEKKKGKNLHFELSGRDAAFDTTDIIEWLIKMFPQAQPGWVINIKKFGYSAVERLFQVPLFNRAFSISLVNGTLSGGQLRNVLDRLKCLEHIYLETKLPMSFRHKKALAYNKICYKDASWVRVEDLFCTKSPFYMQLDRVRLSNACINRYLRHWASTKENVMGKIEMRCEVVLERKLIAKGLLRRTCRQGFFALCENYLEREHPVVIVSFSDCSQRIVITTADKSSFPLEYEMMTLWRTELDMNENILSVSREAEKYRRKITERLPETEANDLLRKVRTLEETRKNLESQAGEVHRRLVANSRIRRTY